MFPFSCLPVSGQFNLDHGLVDGRTNRALPSVRQCVSPSVCQSHQLKKEQIRKSSAHSSCSGTNFAEKRNFYGC